MQEIVIDFILMNEGGYRNVASDPGGETNFGISKRSFPDVDIPSLTEEDARKIYRTKYFVDAGCLSLSMIVSDLRVLSGGYGIKDVQRAYNIINDDQILVDGKIGPQTYSALSDMCVPKKMAQFIPTIQKTVLSRLRRLPNWKDEFKGWKRRLFRYFPLELASYALKFMANRRYFGESEVDHLSTIIRWFGARPVELANYNEEVQIWEKLS